MTPERQAQASGTAQSYTLYAADGRVYASNIRQKLVDLGELAPEGGAFGYRLDGNQASGSGFADEKAALRDLGKALSFLFLDGQFTALTDQRGHAGPDLSDAPQIEITLDEFGGREAPFNANV
jgi:hypothetical protein